MDDEDRRRALLALEIVTAGRPDDELAAAIGSHEDAAACFARLTGHLLQLLALHRGDSVPETARHVRNSLRRA